jgi:hypothetical protein
LRGAPASASRPWNLDTRNIAEDVGIQPNRKADGRYISHAPSIYFEAKFQKEASASAKISRLIAEGCARCT